MSKKELKHFHVGKFYGGNQDMLPERMMKLGGCGAVTACDVCIYLKKYYDEWNLYPFDADNISEEDYIHFAGMMRPYLRPRMSGINRLDTYIEGLGRYLSDVGNHNITMTELPGNTDAKKAQQTVIDTIDAGFPIPCLILKHKNKNYEDYVWHWFLLTGYESFEDTFMVKIVTYGTWQWLDFHQLWNTGYKQKGGLVILDRSSN